MSRSVIIVRVPKDGREGDNILCKSYRLINRDRANLIWRDKGGKRVVESGYGVEKSIPKFDANLVTPRPDREFRWGVNF